jgi:arylsulfatase A-like enzyme
MHEDEKGEWVLFPVSRKGLNPGEITVARLLKAKGYATHCVGKWHLGDQAPFLPLRHGFDGYFGIPYSNDMGASAGSPYPPLPLLRNDEVIEAPYLDALTGAIRRGRSVHRREPEAAFFSSCRTSSPTPRSTQARFRGKSPAVRRCRGEVGRVVAKSGRPQASSLDDHSDLRPDNGGVHKANCGPLRHERLALEGGHRSVHRR